eukprot:scaffold6952_cov48-Attheya_sp.AAC.1
MTTWLAQLALLWTAAAVVVVVHASDFNKPHPHTGKVTPFQPGDPKVSLDGKATKILKTGKPYQTQIQSGAGGRGLVVQDISAPSDLVWGRILDYDNYAKMVPKTVESKNYHVEQHKTGPRSALAQTIYTRMKVGFPMLKLEFFIKHLYYPALNSLTWTLDYTKTSDFDDSCGYWYVIPHPDNSKMTRVYYSVQVSMFDWVPKFVVDFMSSKALTDATGWVKKFSELEAQKKGISMEPDDADTAEPADGPKKGRFPFFGKKKEEEDAMKQLKEDADAKLLEEEQKKSEIAEIKKVRMTRLVLVATVTALVMYNIHLWLSQN